MPDDTPDLPPDGLTPEQVARVDAVLTEALKLPPGERDEFVAGACDDDAAVLAEVRSHLVHVDRDATTAFLARPAELPQTPKPDEPRLPGQIGHYRIRSVLGSGGMGTTYVAQQEKPRRTVAVKVMRRGVTSPTALRRFEYESQLLARLRHPNIVQVYESGVHRDEQSGESIPFFAMEYVPNAKPITEFARAGALGTRDRLRLFSKVCDAIHHGHTKGIIHRDLKPGNILVDSSGEPKIIDFGVARATDSDMAVTTLQTDIGQLIGTMQYMSPEQCDADPHDLDTRSDVYALGVVLYQLLCDQLPYDVTRAAIHEAARVVREEDPQPPSTHDRRLRGDVETITLKALEKDRERRYRSADDLGRDIGRYLDDQPIDARPPSFVYQLGKMARRNRPVFITTAAIAIGLVAAVTATTWGLVTRTRLNRELADTNVELRAQRDEATRARDAEAEQRALAEKRFEQVRELGRTFIYEFDAAIRTLDGATPARELLVTRALEYLSGLRAEAGDDPALLREVADAYFKVADILGGLRSGNLGRVEEAIEQYRASLTIRDGLLTAQPGDLDASIDVAVATNAVADMLQKLERYADALAEYERSEQIAEALRDRHAGNDRVLRLLAMTLQKIGDQHLKLEDLETAAGYYGRSLAIRRSRAAARPDDVTAQRDLTTGLIREADVFQRRGDFDDAMARFEEVLAIRRDLLAADPTSGRARRDVIIAMYYVGRTHMDLDQPDDARSVLTEALQRALDRVESDAVNQRARNDAIMVLDRLTELGVSESDEGTSGSLIGRANHLLAVP